MNILTKKKMEHTKNLFESIDKIEGKVLQVMEKNRDGDCMCVVNGAYLVDVDHRDIEKYGAERIRQ